MGENGGVWILAAPRAVVGSSPPTVIYLDLADLFLW